MNQKPSENYVKYMEYESKFLIDTLSSKILKIDEFIKCTLDYLQKEFPDDKDTQYNRLLYHIERICRINGIDGSTKYNIKQKKQLRNEYICRAGIKFINKEILEMLNNISKDQLKTTMELIKLKSILKNSYLLSDFDCEKYFVIKTQIIILQKNLANMTKDKSISKSVNYEDDDPFGIYSN